jgi:hypothetical protein
LRTRLRYLREQWRFLPAFRPFVPLLLRRLLRRRPARIPPPQRAAPAGERRPATPLPPRSGTGGLTVFSVIRNGIENGYPFVEAYGSWLGHCDRIFVLDGESTDGTGDALRELAELDERFTFVSAPWPDTSAGGASIADFTNEALQLAAPESDRLMYVQADEIYTRDQRVLVQLHHEGALEFAGCTNFWNSFETVVDNEFPMRYLRHFRAVPGVRSIGDGFTFDPGSQPVTRTEEQILHYGWCFPANILKKHVSHARLYSNRPAYVVRGRLAQLMLDEGNYDRRLLDALLPEYKPSPFRGEHADCMLHLLGLQAYDPAPGLDRLRRGAAW